MSEYLNKPDVTAALKSAGCFAAGAHFIVDGQFGSTGKGVMASVYAQAGRQLIDIVTTNAGPNSGHTAYLPTGEKVMTQQIPVASVVLRSLGLAHWVYLNAGSIIDPAILNEERKRWHMWRPYLGIHPNAALIEKEDLEEESRGSVAAIASTAKGVGSALARKLLRRGNIASQRTGWWNELVAADVREGGPHDFCVLVETAQGFSLGINGRFYPHCTSRECTVQQAAADARIPWRSIRTVMACYRTYPIRVGNTSVGYSGDWYPDQEETTWEAIGVEPELTSVTKRIRRVATWSSTQFRESIAINQPNVVFLNFAEYLPDDKLQQLIRLIRKDYKTVMDQDLPLLLLGYGPNNGDVRLG